MYGEILACFPYSMIKKLLNANVHLFTFFHTIALVLKGNRNEIISPRRFLVDLVYIQLDFSVAQTLRYSHIMRSLTCSTSFLGMNTYILYVICLSASLKDSRSKKQMMNYACLKVV